MVRDIADTMNGGNSADWRGLRHAEAMQQALKKIGKSDDDIADITKRVREQLDEHGIPLDGDVPRVPGKRTTPKCRESKESLE